MASSRRQKDTTITPINSSDNPDQILTKLKTMSSIISSIDHEKLDRENTKQMLALLDNLTQKFLSETLQKHPQVQLTLSCCLIDLVRILSYDNEHIKKKSSFILTSVTETLRLSNKFTEDTQIIQVQYLLEQFERSKAPNLFEYDELWQITKEFVDASIDVVEDFQNYPQIFSRVQYLLGDGLENSKEKIKSDHLEEILLPLLLAFDYPNKRTKRIELARTLIKEMSFTLKHLCGKICMDIWRKKGISKKISPPLSSEHICYIIQNLFKIDPDIIREIWPYIENELAVGVRVNRKAYLTLIGKICSSKKSNVSTTCVQIFNYFADTLTSKKNKPFRKELLAFAFKYIRNFTYCKTVSPFEMSTSNIKYDVYQKNLVKLEGKIKDILYEGEDETKAIILEKVKTLSLESPLFISQELLKDVASLLWYGKERKKGDILLILTDLYIQYCCALYEEDIYDFDDTSGNFEFIGGFLSNRGSQRKEIAKKYLWVGETLVSFFHHSSKALFGALQSALVNLIGLDKLDYSVVVKRLFGFYYNIWARSYRDNLNDPRLIKYEEFVSRKLKFNFFSENDLQNPRISFLIKEINKILKVFNHLNSNIFKYLKGLANGDQHKVEDAKKYIQSYYSFTANFSDIEKELLGKVENIEFMDSLEGLMNPENSLKTKQDLLGTIERSIDGNECKHLMKNTLLNVFNKEVGEGLAYLLTQIVTTGNSSIFMREGAIRFSLFIIKQNLSEEFANSQGDVFSHIESNIEQLFQNCKGQSADSREDKYAHANYTTSCLQLLSCLDLPNLATYESGIDVENVKNTITDSLVKLELVNQQAKYAARVVRALDKITSEKVSPKIIERLLAHLDVKSPVLLSTLRTLAELFKDEEEAFIENLELLTNFWNKLITEPVKLPREETVSELSQCKKVLLKTLYTNFYEVEHTIVNELFVHSAKILKKSLIELLLNFSDICAGYMRSDRDYLRIYVIDYYTEIITKEGIELEPESFAKLSLLCYDDNNDIKKYLFSCISYKKARKMNPLNRLYLLYALFLSFSDDENVKFISEETLTNEVKAISDNYYKRLSDGDKREEVHRSAEYLIVYLIFLMCNNPLILLKAQIPPLHFYKCLDLFIDVLDQTGSAHKEEYIYHILNRMKDYKPIIYEECASTAIDFTDIKKKKVAKKPKKGAQKDGPLEFSDIIDAVIQHIRPIYTFTGIENKKIGIALPDKLFKKLQESAAKQQSRKSSAKKSTKTKQPTVQKVEEEEEDHHSDASSTDLVKKLDFTHEDIRMKDDLEFAGFGHVSPIRDGGRSASRARSNGSRRSRSGKRSTSNKDAMEEENTLKAVKSSRNSSKDRRSNSRAGSRNKSKSQKSRSSSRNSKNKNKSKTKSRSVSRNQKDSKPKSKNQSRKNSRSKSRSQSNSQNRGRTGNRSRNQSKSGNRSTNRSQKGGTTSRSKSSNKDKSGKAKNNRSSSRSKSSQSSKGNKGTKGRANVKPVNVKSKSKEKSEPVKNEPRRTMRKIVGAKKPEVSARSKSGSAKPVNKKQVSASVRPVSKPKVTVQKVEVKKVVSQPSDNKRVTRNQAMKNKGTGVNLVKDKKVKRK